MESLKNGTIVRAIYEYEKYNYIFRNGYLIEEETEMEMGNSVLIARKFEILSEEDEEIDIEAIEFENQLTVSANNRMIEQLIKAVKQLNKKLEGK